MKLKKILIWSSIVLFFTTGFRSFPGGNSWAIDGDSPARSKLFVRYTDGTRVLKNDLPGDDALSSDASLTVDEAMEAIFKDYNDVAGSFVTLVASTDGDFAANSTDRIIEVEVGSPPGSALGYGVQTSSGNGITGCTVTIKEAIYDSAKEFTRIMTHEIGHCLGLDHPQDTTSAVMSYFAGTDVYRLQMDDKMGLIYLYPADKDKAREDATLGLSCSRR